MKRSLNEYALTAGLLLIFISIAHAIYGETVVFNDLRFIGFDRALFATIYLPWHQVSWILLISAIGLIVSSFKREYKAIQLFVLLLAICSLVTFVIAFFSTATSTLYRTWPPLFFFGILVLLLILGLRKKERA